MTEFNHLSYEDLAKEIQTLNGREEQNQLIRILQARLSRDLLPVAHSLRFGKADTTHAVQSVLNDRLLPLCSSYRPGNRSFRSYALFNLSRELKKYRESLYCDIHLPSDLRTYHKRVHRFSESHPEMKEHELVNRLSTDLERSPQYISFLLSVESTDELATSAHYDDLTAHLDDLEMSASGDAYEEFYVSEAVYRLLREFRQILTPVELYVFIRKNGILDGQEISSKQLLRELRAKFYLLYNGITAISMIHRKALEKLRAVYSREDIESRFR